MLWIRRKDTTQKDSEFFLQVCWFFFFQRSFWVRSKFPVFFPFLFQRDLPVPLSSPFLIDLMGVGCTAAPPSPCPQLGRLRSARFPSPGGYYPCGSIWLLAGSAGSRTGRVWSSLLALSCGNLSVGSLGSLVLLHAFSSRQTS